VYKWLTRMHTGRGGQAKSKTGKKSFSVTDGAKRTSLKVKSNRKGKVRESVNDFNDNCFKHWHKGAINTKQEKTLRRRTILTEKRAENSEQDTKGILGGEVREKKVRGGISQTKSRQGIFLRDKVL